VLIGLVAAASEISWVLGAVGKDLTLTGRTQLWAEVLNLISQRPFLGWGYMSFFQVDNDIAVQLWTRLRWNPPHSHNGLLEVGLDLGVLGVMFVLALFVQAVVVLINCIRAGARQEAWCFLTFIIVCFIVNLAEPTIIRNQDISTALFNVMLFSCSRVGLAPTAVKRRSSGTVSVLERARPRPPDAASAGKASPAAPGMASRPA
jgi:exopolysaccharide production protein ExoQ